MIAYTNQLRNDNFSHQIEANHQPNKMENFGEFDLNLFMGQAKDYHYDIILNLLQKAKNYDRKIDKIAQYMKSVGLTIEDLENSRSFIIHFLNSNIFRRPGDDQGNLFLYSLYNLINLKS